MRSKILVGATAVAMAIGMAISPASAGNVTGHLLATPDPVYQGGSTTITNVEEAASTCEQVPIPSVDHYPVEVALEIVDPDSETIVDTAVTPDGDGNWTYTATDLQTLGEYDVYATCRIVNSPAAQPFEPFGYFVGHFTVIAQATTTTTAAPTTTVAPTTTTAAVAAIAATPTYTG